MNHDGNLDLIGPGAIALGTGDGTFQQTVTASVCLTPTAFQLNEGNANFEGVSDFGVADFRGDGNLDLSLIAAEVLQLGAFGNAVTANGIACFGDRDGAFAAGPIIFMGEGAVTGYHVTTGDFNGDGKAGVLVSLQPYAEGLLGYSTILGNGDGTFQTQVNNDDFLPFLPTSPKYLPKPVVADMNGDGKSDLIQIAGSLGVGVVLSKGDGTYNLAAALAKGQNTIAVAVADFNNDGLPDIVSTTADVTTVSINTALRIDSVVNAASLAANQPVAPGSLVTIFGAGIGPAAGVSPNDASLPYSMAEVSVTFNDIPAPLSFVSARRINAQVPWEVSGDANIVVAVSGALTAGFRIQTAPIAPGVFNIQGQAFAFNPDGSIAGPSGTILGIPSHPALASDTITVLANGLGPVTPSINDGELAMDTVRTAGSTPVFIGGVACHVPFAGLSRTIAAVNQLNVVVPSGVHGVVPLQINAGGIITAANVTIAIQ